MHPKIIDINADLGEGYGCESEIMPFLSACNIACGGHAGDENSMREAVFLANQHQVKIGAHPSYPDKPNFGRKSMDLSEKDFIDSIRNQIDCLLKIALQSDSTIHHIKPHGALYNDLAKHTPIAIRFLVAIQPFKNQCVLFVPDRSEIEKMALSLGFSICYEAFADRNYNDDYTLVARQNPDAVLRDSIQISIHLMRMFEHEKVKTISQKELPIRAETFCFHSDSSESIRIIKEVNQILNEHGYAIGKL
ncbi:MAG: lactam utilization protein LamB [Bacteroidetes bacterium HGW-Bacteroidetes-13]|nr:MAG: lactam utilization protein LamB [Bacteroidetes bacterium HGW-Bacteroidetes-13]